MDTTIPTEVIEVIEIIDYSSVLEQIAADTALNAQFLQIICAGAVFAMVAALCYFAYKFFRIFF